MVEILPPDRTLIERKLDIEAARCRARVARYLSVGNRNEAMRAAMDLEQIERRRMRLKRNARN